MTKDFHSKKTKFKKFGESSSKDFSRQSNDKNNTNNKFKNSKNSKYAGGDKFKNNDKYGDENKSKFVKNFKSKSFTNGSNGSKVGKVNNFNVQEGGIFKTRYDKNFGNGTFNKLMEVKRDLVESSFIRVNLSKISVEEVEDFLKKNRVTYVKTFIPNAFRIRRSFFNLSSSVLNLTSKIYFQDLASQVPVNLVDFQRLKGLGRRVRVLDMAASPGSKTTQILDLLEFHSINYELIGLEPNKIRLNRLINNIQKGGFGFDERDEIKIINIEGEKFSSKDKFDVVLLDAPCSGNLIGDKDWLKKRDIGGIEQMAALQKKLLRSAKDLVAQDGELVYSTCSMEIEENEMNVDWALRKLGLKVVKKQLDFGFATVSGEFLQAGFDLDISVLKGAYRLMPYVSRTQAFFVCVLKKN